MYISMFFFMDPLLQRYRHLIMSEQAPLPTKKNYISWQFNSCTIWARLRKLGIFQIGEQNATKWFNSETAESGPSAELKWNYCDSEPVACNSFTEVQTAYKY